MDKGERVVSVWPEQLFPKANDTFLLVMAKHASNGLIRPTRQDQRLGKWKVHGSLMQDKGRKCQICVYRVVSKATLEKVLSSPRFQEPLGASSRAKLLAGRGHCLCGIRVKDSNPVGRVPAFESGLCKMPAV